MFKNEILTLTPLQLPLHKQCKRTVVAIIVIYLIRANKKTIKVSFAVLNQIVRV